MHEFEIDRRHYPYATMRVGDGTYVVYMPTQEKLYPTALPEALALRVCARMNEVHYATGRKERMDALPIVRDEQLHQSVQFSTINEQQGRNG